MPPSKICGSVHALRDVTAAHRLLRDAAMRALAFLCLPLVGCASQGDGGTAPEPKLQMNDISVLLPLPTSPGELAAMVSPTAAANGGVLLPQTIVPVDATGIDYARLRVVAFRFDPCFGPTDPAADPSLCQNQLRIVFQPLALDATTQQAFADDIAVHAFYSLTRAQLRARPHS